MDKEIIIIDAFINKKEDEKKLSDFIKRIKLTNLSILLVSNTIITESIIKEVDYYIYDSNNRLFEDDKFEDYNKFILWEIIDGIKFNNIHIHKQKHALSVMVNLFNTINFVKNLGYKFFHRIEYDTILGDSTIKKIKEIKKSVIEENKYGYFTLNHDRKSHGFQYFFCDINFFLKNIPNISTQQDYVDALKKYFNTNKFIIVEEFMYKFLNNRGNLKLIDNKNMEFNDSIWNTTTSDVHLETFEKNCKTRLYKGKDGYILLSKNNIEDKTEREIKFYKNNQEIKLINHSLSGKNTYRYDIINKNFDFVNIIENGELLVSIKHNDINNFYEK